MARTGSLGAVLLAGAALGIPCPSRAQEPWIAQVAPGPLRTATHPARIAREAGSQESPWSAGRIVVVPGGDPATAAALGRSGTGDLGLLRAGTPAEIGLVQDGPPYAAALTRDGFDNHLTVTQSGEGLAVSVHQAGSGNTITLQQSGTLATIQAVQIGQGHQLNAIQGGSGHRLTVVQR